MLRILGLLLLLAIQTNAYAGVIYNWVNVDVNPYTGPYSGMIEFADWVWLSGDFNGSVYSNAALPTALTVDESPILALQFFGTNYHVVNWQFVPCSPAACAAAGLPEGTLVLTDIFGASGVFDVHFNALMTGSLYANSGEADVTMAGSPLWTISELGTDYDICHGGQTERCAGATGLWVLDLDTIPTNVSAPDTFSWPVVPRPGGRR